MKHIKRNFLICLLFSFCNVVWGQTSKNQTVEWVKISEDEAVSIYYNSKIETDKKGNHIVWVKAVYHTIDWQSYFAEQIGSRVPVTMTKTKAMFDSRYCYVLIRQVICYSKAGKVLFNSGDDFSGGWSPVNASDPVGIVGEYLCDQQEKNFVEE